MLLLLYLLRFLLLNPNCSCPVGMLILKDAGVQKERHFNVANLISPETKIYVPLCPKVVKYTYVLSRIWKNISGSIQASQLSNILLCLPVLISLKGEHMVLLLPYGALYSVRDYPGTLAVFVVSECNSSFY